MSKDTADQESLDQLKALNPYAAIHDDKHYLFIKQPSDRSYTVNKVDKWEEQGDDRVWKLATILATDDNAVLEADIYTFDALHKHPAWRIWCAKYEDREQFKADWLAFNELLPAWPEYNESTTYLEGRDIIYSVILGSS